jgi:hypothetical protein
MEPGEMVLVTPARERLAVQMAGQVRNPFASVPELQPDDVIAEIPCINYELGRFIVRWVPCRSSQVLRAQRCPDWD